MIAERSLIIRTGVELASPLAIVVATYLFFAGHNQPGGGFSAGLVLGAIVALRMVVGLPTMKSPMLLLAIGGVIVALVAIGPIFAGDTALDQVIVEGSFVVLGKIKVGTALIFDLGVTMVVVGLMSVVLDALGAARLGRPPVRSSGDDPGGTAGPSDGSQQGDVGVPEAPEGSS